MQNVKLEITGDLALKIINLLRDINRRLYSVEEKIAKFGKINIESLPSDTKISRKCMQSFSDP